MRTWLKYAATILVAFLAGAMTYVVPLLMDPSEPPISWRVIIGMGLSAVIPGIVGAKLTRPGSEPVAHQVNALSDAGVAKTDMIVVPSVVSDVSIGRAVSANPKIQDAARLPPAV
jgi:hypothetical protein